MSSHKLYIFSILDNSHNYPHIIILNFSDFSQDNLKIINIIIWVLLLCQHEENVVLT